jgi:hypothetical protein
MKGETMRRTRGFRKPHARYDSEEGRFVCLICEEGGFEQWIYKSWEIPKHLKANHKIARKRQNILGWNKEFEKEYLKNRDRPLKYEDDSVVIDTTPLEKYEEERKRRLMETKARREALS